MRKFLIVVALILVAASGHAITVTWIYQGEETFFTVQRRYIPGHWRAIGWVESAPGESVYSYEDPFQASAPVSYRVLTEAGEEIPLGGCIIVANDPDPAPEPEPVPAANVFGVYFDYMGRQVRPRPGRWTIRRKGRKPRESRPVIIL